MPLFALLAVVVVGVVGLAVDAAGAYGHERDDHNLADAAALAAATYLSKNTSQSASPRQTGATNAAKTVLAQNGAAGAAANLTLVPVDITGNPTPGGSWANGTAWGVKATITSTHGTFLIRAVGLGSTGATETATAVYGYPSTVGGVAPFALNIDAAQHPVGTTICMAVAAGGSNSDCPSLSSPPPGALKHVTSISIGNNSGTVTPEECESPQDTSSTDSEDPSTDGVYTNSWPSANALDSCFVNAAANGMVVPVTLGNSMTAGSISSFSANVQNAFNSRVNQRPNEAWDDAKLVGSPRVLTVIVLNGDIGNSTVTPYAFQQVFLQWAATNTLTMTLIDVPVAAVPGQGLSTTCPSGLVCSTAIKLIN